MSIDLDPKEVLEHLNCLGYYNITPDQLKDFMKDLKKLIRHDIKKAQQYSLNRQEECRREEGSNYDTNDCVKIPDHFEYSDSTGGDRVRMSPTAGLGCPCENCGCSTQRGPPSPTCHHLSEGCESDREVGGVDYASSQGNSCREQSFRSQPLPHTQSSSSSPLHRLCSETRVRKQPAPKNPPASFIKSQGSTGPPHKCDPVALYHKYQSMWARHPLPGEDPRTSLRWNVRHRMMGATQKQDGPTPKHTSPKFKHKKIPCNRGTVDGGSQEDMDSIDTGVLAKLKDEPRKRQKLFRVTAEVYI